jgi:hypothetical protein
MAVPMSILLRAKQVSPWDSSDLLPGLWPGGDLRYRQSGRSGHSLRLVQYVRTRSTRIGQSNQHNHMTQSRRKKAYVSGGNQPGRCRMDALLAAPL